MRRKVGTTSALVALVGVTVVAWLALGGDDRSRDAGTYAAEPSDAGITLAHADPATRPSSPEATGVSGDTSRIATSASRASKHDREALVTLHGRLVLENGEPARNGVVSLKTGSAGGWVEHRRLIERLGGLREYRRLQRTRRLASRVRALGGWIPEHRAFARPDGMFELPIPESLPFFTLAAEADGALYMRDETFELSPARLRAGFTLVLEPAGSIEGTVTAPDGSPLEGALVEGQPLRTHVGDSFTYWDDFRTFTDSSGRFAFRSAHPGTWMLCAGAEGLTSD